MSTEPEREIEKTLKAYARKRQLQTRAQFELKTAARQRLKHEAARLRAKPEEPTGDWPRWLGSLWLRLAAGTAVILLLAGALFWPRSRGGRPARELAKNDLAPLARPENEARTEAAPAAHMPRLKASTELGISAQPTAPMVVPEATRLSAKKENRNTDLAAAALPPPIHIPSPYEAQTPETKTLPAPIHIPSPYENEIPETKDKSRLPEVLTWSQERSLQTAAGVSAPPAPGGSPLTDAQPAAKLNSDDSVADKSAKISPSAPALGIGGGGGRFGGTGALSVEGRVLAESKQPVKTPPSFQSTESLSLAPDRREDIASFSLAPPAPSKPAAMVGAAAILRKASLPARSAPRQFVQIPATAKNGGATGQSGKVLQSFQMEQAGEQLRVRDADGSVYSGSIGRRDNGEEPVFGDGSKPATFNPGPAATYFFRVQGTNRSLNQLVRFSGDLVPETNAGATNAAGEGKVKSPLEGRLSGRARIGDAPELQIQAEPTGR